MIAGLGARPRCNTSNLIPNLKAVHTLADSTISLVWIRPNTDLQAPRTLVATALKTSNTLSSSQYSSLKKGQGLTNLHLEIAEHAAKFHLALITLLNQGNTDTLNLGNIARALHFSKW